ncbi:MAG: ABC transporter permease, partial [Dysgonamonadaceae bacterium]
MNDTNQTDKKRFRHIRNILAVTIDEYKRLLKDFGVLLILVIAALIYPLLYGTIYLNETIHDMPIAVV